MSYFLEDSLCMKKVMPRATGVTLAASDPLPRLNDNREKRGEILVHIMCVPVLPQVDKSKATRISED
jgi:hypothetical protein